MAKKLRDDSPFTGVDDINLPAISAIKAIYRTPEGERALKYIVETISGYYDLSFRGSERDTCFMEGRRFVGAQIVKLLNINLNKLREKHARYPSGGRDPGRTDGKPDNPSTSASNDAGSSEHAGKG